MKAVEREVFRAAPAPSPEQRGAWPAGNVDLVTFWYGEAERLAEDGEVERARMALRQLLSLQPDHGAAHLLLARVHVVCQRWADAWREILEARRCGEAIPDTLERAVARGVGEPGVPAPPRPAPSRWYLDSRFEIRDRTLILRGFTDAEGAAPIVRMAFARFPDVDEVRVEDDAHTLLFVRRRPAP